MSVNKNLVIHHIGHKKSYRKKGSHTTAVPVATATALPPELPPAMNQSSSSLTPWSPCSIPPSSVHEDFNDISVLDLSSFCCNFLLFLLEISLYFQGFLTGPNEPSTVPQL